MLTWGIANRNVPTQMTTRQISDTLQDIYGFEASEGFISDVTDKILPQIEEWQNRPLEEVSPVIFIDAIHYSVRDEGHTETGGVCHAGNQCRRKKRSVNHPGRRE